MFGWISFMPGMILDACKFPGAIRDTLQGVIKLLRNPVAHSEKPLVPSFFALLLMMNCCPVLRKHLPLEDTE